MTVVMGAVPVPVVGATLDSDELFLVVSGTLGVGGSSVKAGFCVIDTLGSKISRSSTKASSSV